MSTLLSLPPIEFRSLEEIKTFQNKRLCEMLHYVSHKSPYYKRLFNDCSIDISSIKTIDDLQIIPTTSKIDLQTYNADFYCVQPTDIIDYITTSGTLGDPVAFALSDKDLERLAYNEAISFMCAEISKSDIMQLMTTIDKRFMAGLAYFLGARKLGAGIIRVGNGIPELQWDTIFRLHPNTIIVVPSFILKIIQYAEENNINYRNSSIKKAICIGENIREQDFSLNLLGQRIQEKWDIQLISTYASTEMATTFCECPFGKGGHHHPELIITELLDENGNVVNDGEIGELTITTLGVQAMPLLRFRTGDIAKFHTEQCQCGRNTMRISPIIGRRNHMIKFKGTTLYPAAIFDVLDSVEYIQNYIIEVNTDELDNDNLIVRIGGCTKKNNDAEKELKDRFRAKLRVAPIIEFYPFDTIHRQLFPEISRKPQKFIDKRKNRI